MTQDTALTAALPEPNRERWQPLRLGLVDFFYYEAEEFHFYDGRLLLRGNNGTGKSKVLALTLPFLLDADMSATRVEPDGDRGKRMAWNLLLDGDHPHAERLGYTWIEFGRRTEDGTPSYRTLGCGIKAVRDRGIAGSWFFVTSQRVGPPGQGELQLVDATRTALPRKRLEEAVEGHGLVYDQARDYRRAVDEELFGLGEHRYTALVNLLIQLRQPQLSKRPNATALDRALTQALPPMDQAVIADVAEAFRSLDEERDQLTSMIAAERAAARFLEHYRSYARVAARRRARAPRDRNSEYESLSELLRAAELEHAEAEEALTTAETDLDAQRRRHADLVEEERSLRQRPEMRDADALERGAEEERRAGELARDAERDRQHAAGELARAERRLAVAGDRAETAASTLTDVLDRADGRAGEAGIRAEHDHQVARPLRPDDGRAGTDIPDVRAPAEDLVQRRERSLTHVDGLLAAATEAESRRRDTEARLDDADTQLTELEERHVQAGDTVRQAGADLITAVRAYLDSCVELCPADPVGLLERLTEWAGHLSGPNPAHEEAAAAARLVADRLTADRAQLALERESLDATRRELRDERELLRHGGQRDPHRPHTRALDAREGRPGAPLWRLVDFAASVPEVDRAGIEAALEAAGLLDAWVTPDGAVDRDDVHDVTVDAATPAAGSSLADVLVPSVDPGDPQAASVPGSTVTRVLCAVGVQPAGAGPHDTCATRVDARGRFRLGVLAGAWAKDRAEYLGEGAREAARRARIEEINAELADLDARVSDIEESQAGVERRRATLDAELAALPSDDPVRHAHAALAEAAHGAARARERRDDLAGTAERAAQDAEAAGSELRDTAADLDLPSDPTGLRAVRDALGGYRVALAELWPAVRERGDSHAAAGEAEADAERHRGHLDDLAERAARAEEEHAGARQRHATLRETVGAAVAELQRLLARNAEDQRDCARQQREADDRLRAATERRGVAQGRTEQLRTDIDTAARDRATAIAALRRFAGTGLLGVALPELQTPPPDDEWAARPAVEVARAIERHLQEVDDGDRAWDRVQKHLSTELNTLRDTLSQHGHAAAAQSLEDGIVVHVMFQGRERAVPELAEALAEEVRERRSILSAREQEVLENHLMTEVAGTLQELVSAAERQAGAMSREIEERPTSTGMALRLAWHPSASNAPTGLDAVRQRLRQHADAWSPEDRRVVGEFLQAEIDRVRTEDEGGTWIEHLTRAFDYRLWHEFTVYRWQNGDWRRADGPASGGERVLSMSIPLFAAASSHYASAGHPHAPRLITLDEAFAGVDDDSRAKCLGLLRSFDLDVVMTSEREWGCYPEVPGLAIAQLSRMDGVRAVLVTRWQWDGHRRTRDGEPPPAVPTSGGSPASEVQDDQEALWS